MSLSLSLRITPFDSRDEASAYVANRIARAIAASVSDRGRAGVIFPGGRSPLGVYGALRQMKIDWARVIITLTDERRVAETSPDSNLAQLKRHLLAASGPNPAITPLVLSDDAAEIARAAERLRGFPWPADIVLLGMGEDGHVASLFPGTELSSLAGLTIAATSAPRPPERVSLTPEALLNSREVLLLVFGSEKRRVFDRAMRNDTKTLPPFMFLLEQREVPVEVVLAD